MTDETLQETLRYLRIDQTNYRVLALLPLVQVAWADGRVQAPEHALIHDTATSLGLEPGGPWEPVLADWLAAPPTALQYLRGQQVLLALAQRSHPGFELEKNTLDELVDLSLEVAEAAGGLFGLAFQVHEEERRALADIAQILSLGPTIDWSQIRPTDGPSW